MTQYLQSLGSSLLFATLASLTALALSLVFVAVRSVSVDAFLQTGFWKKFRAVPDLLASVCESIPLLILLILLGQTGMQEIYRPFLEYAQKALILGLFMFPSIWRYMDSRLDLSREDIYPQQLMLWKVPSLKVGLDYVLWKNNLRGIFSSLIWVFTSAFTLDLSIGFLANFGLGASYINWYDGSLGSRLGSVIRASGMASGSLYLIIAFVLIILLYQWAQKLMPHKLPVYNKILERPKADQEALYSFRELRITPQNMDITVDPANPLNLPEGGFIWLNGPSGSGKSLFVKAIMQLLEESGERPGILPKIPVIYYKDKKLSDATVLMPQEPDLYIFPYLSVRDYLYCMIDKDVEQITRQVQCNYKGADQADLLTLLGVVSWIQDTQISNISAGEKRMVAFVVAMEQSLHEDKKLIIFDEPDSSLDTSSIQALKFYLASINQKSVIYITHNVMHSKDLYETIANLGIWQLTTSGQQKEKHVVQSVDNVPAHYEQIHGAINETLAILRNKFQAIRPTSTHASATLLSIRFPLTIRIGDGLRLKASQNTRENNDMTVRKGDGIIGIVGDNGIGKSSFLRTIIGLYETERPSISLGYSPLRRSQSTHESIYKHNICYIYDDIEKALPGNLPLSEVIRDLEKVYRRGLNSTRYISSFGRTELQKPLVQFSGGERQKIVFDLVCHLIKTDLLLLDEPFSRLDWGDNLIQVTDWLREKSSQCPVIIISHNREILEAIAPHSTWLLEKC